MIRIIAIFICTGNKPYISKYFSVLPYAFCCRVQICFLTISSVHLFNIQIIKIRKRLPINIFDILEVNSFIIYYDLNIITFPAFRSMLSSLTFIIRSVVVLSWLGRRPWRCTWLSKSSGTSTCPMRTFWFAGKKTRWLSMKD